MIKVLFVCLANLCRSPIAEEIAKEFVKKFKLEVIVDSAGANVSYPGTPPFIAVSEFAKSKGYKLTSRSRQITEKDFQIFDYILVMDDYIYELIEKMENFSTYKYKIYKLGAFTSRATMIKDPNYCVKDLEIVLGLLEESIDNFFSSHLLF